MKPAFLLAATAMLTLTLSACGGASEDAADPVAEAAPATTADAAVDPAATPTPGATDAAPTPGATPSASASATPTPTASASARPAAAAAPVAAATPPAAFATCGVCHAVAPGQNMIGPSLAGVVGRRSGSVAGFSYSPALRGANITWNDGTLDRYLADPAAVVPGGAMPAPGVDAAQRRAIIAYLKTL